MKSRLYVGMLVLLVLLPALALGATTGGAAEPLARSLAGTVAEDLLHGTKVPARIGGLKVTVKEPCSGCTPDTQVTAKSGQELVTFTVEGGA